MGEVEFGCHGQRDSTALRKQPSAIPGLRKALASSVDRIRQQEIAPFLPAFVFTETAQGGVIPSERSKT